MSTWEIWLDDARGNRLALLDQARSFSLMRVVNAPGAFSLALPGSFDPGLVCLDGMLEFWRAPDPGALKLVAVGLVRTYTYQEIDGADGLVISGPDQLELLSRRVVAYAAGSAQAGMTDQADDMLKAIVHDNMESDAAAARDWSSLGLAVLGDLAAGPSVTKSFAWKNVLSTLQEIAEGARQAGTEVYFDLLPRLVADNQIGFDFATFTGQRGRDHSDDSGEPVMFAKQWGNLADPVLVYDYSSEVNYVYAGGQGEGADREIVEVSDARRSGASPWNRREAFADARNEVATGGVTAKGNAVLAEGRPRLHFSGELLSTPEARYGVDWEFGDRVTAGYRGVEFNGLVRSVKFSIDSRGNEQISARLEVDA